MTNDLKGNENCLELAGGSSYRKSTVEHICISRLCSVSCNLRSGVIFFLFFASLLLWLEREKNNA